MGRAIMRVAVLDDYQHVAADMADWSVLDGRAEVVFFHDHRAEQHAVVDRLKDFDAVVAMRERTPLPATILERLPRLRLIVTASERNLSVDMHAAARLGMMVVGTRSSRGLVATVELTWALILGVARGIAAEDAAIRAGHWQVGLGASLHGKTLGIVGLGNVGSLMPPVARALGMEVIAWSRNLTEGRANEVGVAAVGHKQFFETADVITVHIKLGGARSVGYVGADEFAIVQPTAYLVNTSRGPVVDETTLVSALHAGRIAGAALDVFATEPLPSDSPLRTCPNLLMTPHIGFATRDSYEQYYGQMVEDLVAYLDGSPIRVLAAPASDGGS